MKKNQYSMRIAKKRPPCPLLGNGTEARASSAGNEEELACAVPHAKGTWKWEMGGEARKKYRGVA